jgi:hypothetical protein
VKEVVRALNIPIFEKAGFEALYYTIRRGLLNGTLRPHAVHQACEKTKNLFNFSVSTLREPLKNLCFGKSKETREKTYKKFIERIQVLAINFEKNKNHKKQPRPKKVLQPWVKNAMALEYKYLSGDLKDYKESFTHAEKIENERELIPLSEITRTILTPYAEQFLQGLY